MTNRDGYLVVCCLCLVCCVVNTTCYFSIEVDAEKHDRDEEEELPIVKRCKELREQLEKATGYGGPLIRGIFDFQEDLRYLYEDVRRNRAPKMRLKIYFQLREKGGPLHLTATVNDGLLRETFGWTTYEVNDIHEMLRDTQTLWDKIGKEIEKQNITPPPW